MPILPTFSAPRAAPFTGMRFPIKAAHSMLADHALRDKRGTILFHGGNDSLLEEFTDLLLYLARGGYEILAFEGPGQGAALRKSGLTFTPEWEKPVGAVLDFYGAEDVTIVGVSLGGELAMRAAAMEPRIRRVVAWCVLPSIYGALMADKPGRNPYNTGTVAV